MQKEAALWYHSVAVSYIIISLITGLHTSHYFLLKHPPVFNFTVHLKTWYLLGTVQYQASLIQESVKSHT